jgi:hypothetical protein
MRAAWLWGLVLAAGTPSCGTTDSGGDGPACGGGFTEEVPDRYGHDPRGECYDMGFFSGVEVSLPSVSPDRGWVLSGTIGDDPFTCAVAVGMLEGEPCSDNPKVRWFPSLAGFPKVDISAHPCHLELGLEVEAAPVVSGTFRPVYEWSEPNGAGCGWKGEATVVLSPDGA